VFTDKTTKNVASIVSKIGKDISIVEAELIWQWYDERNNEWITDYVERKSAENFQNLLDAIFKGWKHSARIKAWEAREPIYNDEKVKIGYIFTPQEKDFDNQDRYYNERLMVIFYRSKYDYLEVD